MLPAAMNLEFLYGIKWAGFQMLLIRRLCMVRFSLILCRYKGGLDHVQAFLYMEHSGRSVPLSVIIVHTIRYITGLLRLQNHSTAFDSMNTARIDLEEISLMNRDLTDQLRIISLLHHLLQLFLIFCMVPYNNRSIRLTIQNVPAFCLSQRTIFIGCGICIIRMNLDA